MRVVFIHPDLGIGGAERLVVDAATALQDHGHSVKIITAHHDRSHCFSETRDGTLDVLVCGDWLPRSVLGRCRALCAYVRMCYAALVPLPDPVKSPVKYQMVWECPLAACFVARHADVFFVDQISACLVLLRILLPGRKIVFYCHFPDQLLTQSKIHESRLPSMELCRQLDDKMQSVVKRVYRLPIDCLEEWSTGLAHCILVNSAFTESIFRQTFRTLSDRRVTILYPTFTMPPADVTRDDLALGDLPTSAEIVFLSLNRYERKKNIDLVVAAFALLLENLERSLGAKCHLAIAGGYDSRVTENVQHYSELKGLAKHLALFETRGRPDRVTFFRSPSDGEKRALLDRCTCVVYTPRGEHFGIVPVEAMAAGRPVIAVNDGGPKESIVPDVTGFLCDGSPQSFAFAMEKVVLNADWLVKKFGDAGISRANTVFSKAAFGRKLDSICARLVSEAL